MSEVNVEELVQTMSAQRAEAMRTALEADLTAAFEKGKEVGKAEGISEGEFRGRKQGVIRVAMNCVRESTLRRRQRLQNCPCRSSASLRRTTASSWHNTTHVSVLSTGLRARQCCGKGANDGISEGLSLGRRGCRESV